MQNITGIADEGLIMVGLPNTDNLDERYVTYREHAELREEVMRQRAKLEHLPDEVRELRRDIAALKDLLKAQPQASVNIDQMMLAVHRIMDSLKGSSPSWVERVVGLIGAAAIGAVAFRLVGFGS